MLTTCIFSCSRNTTHPNKQFVQTCLKPLCTRSSIKNNTHSSTGPSHTGCEVCTGSASSSSVTSGSYSQLSSGMHIHTLTAYGETPICRHTGLALTHTHTHTHKPFSFCLYMQAVSCLRRYYVQNCAGNNDDNNNRGRHVCPRHNNHRLHNTTVPASSQSQRA